MENKTYSILKPFLLSFIENDEQINILFNRRSGGYVETDGKTVWYVNKNIKHKSITNPDVIERGLIDKAIQTCYVLDLEVSEQKVEAAVLRLQNCITIHADGTTTIKTGDEE